MALLDDLTLIANILEQHTSATGMQGHMQQIAKSRHPDSLPATNALCLELERRRRYSDIGNVSLSAVVIRELLFTRREVISKELQKRLSSIVKLWRQWERKWSDTVRANAPEAFAMADHRNSQFPEGTRKYPPEVGYFFQDGKGTHHYDALEQLAEVTDATDDTVSWIKQLVIMLQPQTAEAGKIPGPVTAKSTNRVTQDEAKDEESWIHDRGAVPPKQYWTKDGNSENGPLRATRTELGACFSFGYLTMSEQQLRNNFKSFASETDSAVWLRRTTSKVLEAFFKDRGEYDRAIETVNRLRQHKAAKAKTTQRKSTKVKRPRKP